MVTVDHVEFVDYDDAVKEIGDYLRNMMSNSPTKGKSMATKRTTKKAVKTNKLAIPAGFAFQFANGASSIAAPQEYASNFRVRKQVADKLSDKVTVVAIHFDEKTREMRAFGSDGMTRKCKVDRLPSLAEGRALWKKLQRVGKTQELVSFVAAGGFSPDVWFYDVQ